MESAVIQLLVQLLAAAVPVTGLVLALRRDRHPLAATERLTKLIADMPAGAARDALSDRRDALAVDWLLEQEAPRESDLLWLRRLIAGLATLAILIWLIFAVANPQDFWPWLIYILALVLALVSQLPAKARRRHREAWMLQERAWRGLPVGRVATRVTSSGSSDRRSRKPSTDHHLRSIRE